MLSTQLLFALLVSLVATSTIATPVPYSIPVARRSLRLHERDDDVFDSNQVGVVQYEQRKVENKYRNAMRYLGGVSLAQVDLGYEPMMAMAGRATTSTASVQASSVSRSPSLTTLSPSTAPRAATSSHHSSSPSSASSAQPTPSSMAVDISPVPRGRTRSAGSSVSLTDYISGSMDVLYYGNLMIGTPAQTLTVDFDTGSADLWLPANCSGCQSTQFNPSASSSYVPNGDAFEVQYGSGSVSGVVAQESVSIAGTAVAGQYFGAVNNESDDFLSNPNSGVIGMGFSSISSMGKATYFENLISNKAVAAPMFGFHLTRKQTTGSQLCIGCYDSSKFTGVISWVPVISQTYWSVSMTGFSANGNKQNALNTTLIGAIDTGTTLIYVPTAVADAFYGQIPGAQRADQFGAGFYTFPCKTAATLSISLNAKPFAISMADFNLGRTASGSASCVGGVLAVGDGFPDNLAIIGDAFLKSWYSVYDYSNGARVGLASSTNNH
ncbi:hypothetical protein P7C73_g5480, partial [Tremellales sp. Uapishka_1]